MKKFLLLLILIFNSQAVKAEKNFQFFLESAYKNNPKLNAERKNLKATKENINISRSEFLPSISISGNQSSSESSNKTNKSGLSLSDSNLNTESSTVSVDQKVFQGFKGYNSFKKSELEVKQALLKLNKEEKTIILESASAYFDLIFKINSKKFNIANVYLFERQVESDSARLQKGEITLTDLAQSESSLAGANADSIIAKTELFAAKTNFERITTEKVPDIIDLNEKIDINLPNNLQEALNLAKTYNINLLIAKLDYQIAEKNLAITKADFSPSASINYSKSKNKDFSSTINELDKETVKAKITWPIIKGGKNFSSVKKSSLSQQKSALLLKDTENTVMTNITNTWTKYQSLENVLRATEAQLKAAEIANEGITMEYDSGNTRTTLEVIQSRSLLLDARITLAKAKRDFMISKLNLAMEAGTLSLESIQSL